MRILIYILITAALFAADPAGFINQALLVKATRSLVKTFSPDVNSLPEKAGVTVVDKGQQIQQAPDRKLPEMALSNVLSTSGVKQQDPDELVEKLDSLLRSMEEEQKGGKS